MDRRTFIASAGAAIVTPALPASSQPFVGLDLARGPDESVTRMVAFQNGLVREVHRVTGIPRYQLGRDTWQDQVDAGESVIIQKEEK